MTRIERQLAIAIPLFLILFVGCETTKNQPIRKQIPEDLTEVCEKNTTYSHHYIHTDPCVSYWLRKLASRP